MPVTGRSNENSFASHIGAAALDDGAEMTNSGSTIVGSRQTIKLTKGGVTLTVEGNNTIINLPFKRAFFLTLCICAALVLQREQSKAAANGVSTSMAPKLSTANRTAKITSEKCASPGFMQTLSVAASQFQFTFEPVKGVERKQLIVTLHCVSPRPLEIYMRNVMSLVPKREGDVLVYRMFSQELRVSTRYPDLFYFCEPDFPGSDVLRGCQADVKLGQGANQDTGLVLVATYGIDYKNQNHIHDINNSLRAIVAPLF